MFFNYWDFLRLLMLWNWIIWYYKLAKWEILIYNLLFLFTLNFLFSFGTLLLYLLLFFILLLVQYLLNYLISAFRKVLQNILSLIFIIFITLFLRSCWLLALIICSFWLFLRLMLFNFLHKNIFLNIVITTSIIKLSPFIGFRHFLLLLL